MQVELHILQTDSGETWEVSAHLIVLLSSMLVFIDWTLCEHPALVWDKATMGVVSEKSIIWLILSQEQIFIIFFIGKFCLEVNIALHGYTTGIGRAITLYI